MTVERHRTLEVGQVFDNGAGVGGTMGGQFLILSILPQIGVVAVAAGLRRADMPRTPAPGSFADVGGSTHWIPWSKLNWPRAIPGQLYRFGGRGGANYVGRPDGRLALLTDAANPDHFREFEPEQFTVVE